MIQKAFGYDAMSAVKIKVWHKRLKGGQESIESNPRSGRPSAEHRAAVVNDLIQTATNEPDFLQEVITLKGTEVSLSCVHCFLYLVSSSINVSIFHITWLDTYWTVLIYIRLCVCIYIYTCTQTIYTFIYIYIYTIYI